MRKMSNIHKNTIRLPKHRPAAANRQHDICPFKEMNGEEMRREKSRRAGKGKGGKGNKKWRRYETKGE